MPTWHGQGAGRDFGVIAREPTPAGAYFDLALMSV